MSERYKFHNQEKMYFVTPTVVQWCDIFTRTRYKNILVDSINYCIAEKGLRVHCWVLMTNHAHLIISTQGEKMEHILRDMKKFTSKAIVKALRENGMESRDWLVRTFEFEGKRNSNNHEIPPMERACIARSIDLSWFLTKISLCSLYERKI